METMKDTYHLQSEPELTGQFNVADYIKSLRLEGALVGGFSRESVYLEIKKLSELFQRQVQLLEAQLKQDALEAETLQTELDGARRETAGLRAVLEAERQSRSAYDDQFSVLEHAVKAVRQTEEDAKNAAASQAAYIIETARGEAERIMQENRSAILRASSQREAVSKAACEIGKLLETLHACAFMTITEVEKQQKLFTSLNTEGTEDSFRKNGAIYVSSGQYASS